MSATEAWLASQLLLLSIVSTRFLANTYLGLLARVTLIPLTALTSSPVNICNLVRNETSIAWLVSSTDNGGW